MKGLRFGGKEPIELTRQLIFQEAFELESTPKPKSVYTS